MIELYNLATDPTEKKNLANSNSKKAVELHVNLAAWQKQLGVKMPLPNPDYDPNAKPKPHKSKEKSERSAGALGGNQLY